MECWRGVMVVFVWCLCYWVALETQGECVGRVRVVSVLLGSELCSMWDTLPGAFIKYAKVSCARNCV